YRLVASLFGTILSTMLLSRLHPSYLLLFPFFFFNPPPPPELSTLSLHDALPTSPVLWPGSAARSSGMTTPSRTSTSLAVRASERSEEHTSELQSLTNLVCRLLLEKKKTLIQPLPSIQQPTTTEAKSRSHLSSPHQ